MRNTLFCVDCRRATGLWGRLILFLFAALAIVPDWIFAGALTHGEAPGTPGADPKWVSSRNTILGTARTDDASFVWFTGFNGIVGEVFYPASDTPAIFDWQMLVGDAAHTWVDEEKVTTTSRAERIDPHALSWKVTNVPKSGHPYRIEKRIFTDPKRNTLVVEVTFTATRGTLGDFILYTLLHPALDNDGQATTAYTGSFNGRPMLIARNTKKTRRDENGNVYRPVELGSSSALASSLDFKPGMLSSGFVGTSDGYQDLLGGRTPDMTMNWTYDRATDGNVAQMAMFDLGPVAGRTSVTFTLALGFGESEASAEAAAAGTLGETPAALLESYNSQWKAYAKGLNNLNGAADEQYYVAAMVLKAAQDKTSGGMVAGLGNPWGDTGGSWKTANGQTGNDQSVYVQNSNGYHVVFPRDQYKIASALIVAGDTATAGRALDFLFKDAARSGMQRADGHFPRYAFTDAGGTIEDSIIQPDQTALPIILAWKLKRTDASTYARHVKPAAEYLLKNGPRYGHERWEENWGYSPSTIAAEIAGLVCAADIARANGDEISAARYLARADYWQGMVENWTFTTRGKIAGQSGGKAIRCFFERLDDDGNPNDGHTIFIGNGGGPRDERSIVDAGFLELVRHGVKSWDNPYIVASLPAVDATIKQSVPGKGDGFFRYNTDGYGENLRGVNWPCQGMRGRLWPLLSGERGHYVIASGNDAAAYLRTMRHFANSSFFVPEQVFDAPAPPGFAPGEPTKSMNPLNWAMGEYVSLFASNASRQVLDCPAVVFERYVKNAYKPRENQAVDYLEDDAKQGKALRLFYKGTLAASPEVALHWSYNDTSGTTDQTMMKRSDGFWETTVSVPIDAARLNFVFSAGTATDDQGGLIWDVQIAPNAFTPFSSPVDSWPNPAIGGQSLTIYYNGPLAAKASSIQLRWGHDAGFLNPTDVPMTKRADGYWTSTITVPAENSSGPDQVPFLQFAFHDEAGNWDNNGGPGKNFSVMRVPK
jgi:glucoamylase